MRSRSKFAGFLPILKTVDDLNAAAAHVDVDMSMGENWLAAGCHLQESHGGGI
jgi:hypothetical protein